MVVDFTQLANPISKAFDSDFIDVYRDVKETAGRELLYENVPCHIAIKTTDNADPTSVDVQPIIKSLAIHCNNFVDLKNNDYIVAKKTDTKGNALHYYSGLIGEPSVSMARQYVNMRMETLKPTDEPPTPPPAPDGILITINYLTEDDIELRDSVEQYASVGSKLTVKPLIIDNYKINRIVVNGTDINSTKEVVIEELEDNDYSIDFYYQEIQGIEYIRPLVNGYYTKDNGNVKSGYHLYAKIPVLDVINENSIKLKSDRFEHEEIGTIRFAKEEIKGKTCNKFIDNFDNWHIITANPEKVNDGYIITFDDTEPVDAYITHWYD